MELAIIQSKIYEIRGYKVMLDFDLAEIYGIETKRLKEQVRRNIERFPDDFMFELTVQEWVILRSQFATSSWGGARKEALVELQTKNKVLNKPRNPIGFMAPQYSQRTNE